MNIGIVSDIHSNFWALKTMLKQEQKIETWFCLGDMIGLLPMVNETLDLIEKSRMVVILGDHEKALLNATSLPQSRTATEVLEIQKRLITSKNRTYLQTLSEKRRIRIDNVWFTLIHSFESCNEEHSYCVDIQSVEETYHDDIVIYGHTHLPMVWYGKKGMIINPGSLGFPITKQKRHLYAVYNTDCDCVEFKSVLVDTQKIIDECVKQQYPKRIIELLKNQHT